jgi:hypothetical protein
MTKRQFSLAVVGAFVLAGLAAQPSAAATASPGAPTLRYASDLRPTHGVGTAARSGYLPLHAREYAQAKAAANAKAGLSAHGQAAAASGTGPTVTSYPNVSPSFGGIYQTGVTPPDTTGAIGPDRYIETINTSYAIYSRTGALMNSGSLSALTGVSTGLFGYALSDPQMMWDAKTQRFYYAAVYYDSLLFSDNGIAIGWSRTATPSSSNDFCKYTLGFGGELPDYPKLGDASDFLLFGYNQFGNFASTYDGSAIAVLNKPPAGSTCPSPSAFAVHFSGVLHNADGSLAATPVPANLVDDGTGTGTGYVVANADLTETPSANFVSVYPVKTNGTDSNGIPVPAIGGPTNVPVPGYALPANAPQQGSSYLLDTLDGRFEAAVAAVDPGHAGRLALWTAHSVYGGPGAEERWYEIDPAAGSVLQSGTAGTSSLFVWNGAVSPDRANTGSSAAFGDSMAMSVSTSSASSYPAIQFVSKAGSAPQTDLADLVRSSGPDVDLSCSNTAPCRWGDYSGASPDPATAGGTAGKVWLGNQYNLAGGTTSSTAWRTWLFAVTPMSAASSPSLAFSTAAQVLTAGTASSAMGVTLSAPQPADVLVTLASNSPGAGFAVDPNAVSWPGTLTLTIASGSTAAPAFYYRDTRAGSPTLTASASGVVSATQVETVGAAALANIAVSPGTATVGAGGSQTFTASGTDSYGNPVGVSTTSWTTTAPGTMAPSTGSSSTFTAGATAGSGLVIATLGGVSGQASVTVTTNPPAAPSNLVATPKGKRIALSWSGSGSGVTYNLYRGTASGAESLYATGLIATSTNDATVVSGTTYYYVVTAVGAGGESARSNEASARAR